MKLCDECYIPLCDFCKHYNFNERWCSHHQKTMEPDEDCQDFHCRNAPEAE